jgi:DNA-binding response OmpR family regulator
MKILLCEDDSNIATIARMAIEQIGGHKVSWVADGEAALLHAQDKSLDVILLDEMMPKMSGPDVCTALKKQNVKVAPIIFMSANPQAARVEEFRPLTIGYIAKPFDPVQLCAQIEQLLGGKNGKDKKAV